MASSKASMPGTKSSKKLENEMKKTDSIAKWTEHDDCSQDHEIK
jgi:hypothetical protein